jgi:signal transduction histidine kinase/CheY-like chemotaxis protein
MFDCEGISYAATALVRTQTRDEMSKLIVEMSQNLLNADTVALFALQSDGYYRLIQDVGCSDEIKKEWALLPMGRPPDGDNLVYIPLKVHERAIGTLSFGYNDPKERVFDKSFALTLANLYAQALDRVHWFEQERLARREAELANQAKTDFLANISHEIRTPIGVIHGFTDLILKYGNLDAKQQRWINVIRQNSMHLSSIIGDVLDISKIEAQKVELNKCFFSLTDLIEDVRAITSFKAEERDIRLALEYQDTSLQIYSDPTHLRQILVNVISNAIKFTPEGEVRVKVECEESKLRVYVEDTGIGIALSDQGRIFEPFVQAENPMSKKYGGTGLGLSISKQLTTLLGGDLILLRSAPGQGSSFLIEIPCEMYYVDRPSSSMRSRSTAGQKRLSGLKVLLADDSLDNQDLFTQMLSDEGAQVEVVENGFLAIERAMKRDFNVVLMDIQMPELDGFQAASSLRQKGYSRPIVALTARAISDDKERSIFSGFDDYITKPVSRSMLIQTVKRLGQKDLYH